MIIIKIYLIIGTFFSLITPVFMHYYSDISSVQKAKEKISELNNAKLILFFTIIVLLWLPLLIKKFNKE